MNKLFAKIATAFAGMAMAVGVGVAVSRNGDKASEVDAAASTVSWTASAAANLGSQISSVNGTDTGTISTGSFSWSYTRTLTQLASGKKDNISYGGATNNKYIQLGSNNAQETISFTTSAFSGKVIKSISVIAMTNQGGHKLSISVSGSTYASCSNVSLANATLNSGTITSTHADGTKTYTADVTDSTGNITIAINGPTARKAMYVAGISVTYDTPSTKTLSSITVSENHRSFTVGDTFVKETVTAHYSDSSTADATTSATFSGYNMSTAGNQTVNVSYSDSYGSANTSYSITVSSPTTPTISLSASSFSGYTGQAFSVTATYANLTSDFAWAASGTGTISGGVSGTTGDSRDGTSTYSGTLTGAGTKTLTASGGGATTQTYTITITKTTVSLNKASTSISVGRSETLTATTNVGSVTWESSNTSAATVSNGVVSVPSNATVGATSTITATSAVDTSVKATCTVTVAEAPLADVLTSSVIPAAAVGSSTSSWGTASTFSDYTGAVYTGRFMGVNSSSFIGRLNDSTNGYIYTSTVPSNMKLKSVTIESMTASKTVGVYAQSGAYTAAPSDKSTALGTITPSSLTYEFDSESNYNAICLRGHTSATEIGTVTIEYEAIAVLDRVTTSGQTTLFTAGNKWSYGGTLTAHYTGGKDDATATPTSYKYGASGIDPTTAGTAITTSTTLTKAEHDGKYIYVIYTEDNVTKYCSYQITVSYAAVTSVEIETHAAEIGLNETYDYTLVHVTVKSSYADQGYEWIVHANTVGGDYTFNESGLTSKDTEGTITLWCRSTADNSKYDELVVTVTGNPTAEFTPASVSGYVGKGTSVAFTYGNITDTSKISVSSNNASVTVGAITASAGEGSVAITFVSAGSATLSISYDGGSALDTVGVTVSADSVTALTWSAPTIKVYSGASTTVSDASSWNVHYTMASGSEGNLSYGEYTLKLGGSAITLPHTWSASDDAKVLSIEYGGFTSPTTSTVDVTQSLQAVNMPDEGDSYYQLVSTDADLEAGRYLIVSQEDNLAFDGSLETLDAGQNHFSVTINNGVIADDSASSGKYFDLTVSGTAWTITSASGSSVAHSGSKNGMDGKGTNTISISSGVATIAGSGGKELQYNATSGSSNERFRYYTSAGQHSVSLFKLVTEEGEGSTNIANVAGHEAAQKAVVAFAKAMNAAFDNTANCTDGVASAWSTASSAYSSNITNNASLSADEKAYANNLIKYATAQYTDDTDEDFSYCLERAMKTYEVCIQKHGQTGFIGVRTVTPSIVVNPVAVLSDGGSTVTIIVVTSMIGLSAVGGYFFLRKRKEI